jgi:DNA transformation protein
MFGGLGVFRQGLMFGLVADDILYLKGDAETAGRYEAEGCRQFVYESKGKPTAMSYWRLPDELYDDPEAFAAWAETAFAAALRSQKKSKKEKPRRA